MDEIKKLISYLIMLSGILGAVMAFFLALPIGDVGAIVGYLGIAIAGIAAFIKFLKELNDIIDEKPAE